MLKSESIVENEILSMLAKSKRGYFWKNTSSGFFDGKSFRRHASPFAINGTLDILGVFDGRFVALEVKKFDGKPAIKKASQAQLAFIENIRSRGGVGSVVDSAESVRECFLKWFDVCLE